MKHTSSDAVLMMCTNYIWVSTARNVNEIVLGVRRVGFGGLGETCRRVRFALFRMFLINQVVLKSIALAHAAALAQQRSAYTMGWGCGLGVACLAVCLAVCVGARAHRMFGADMCRATYSTMPCGGTNRRVRAPSASAMVERISHHFSNAHAIRL